MDEDGARSSGGRTLASAGEARAVRRGCETHAIVPGTSELAGTADTRFHAEGAAAGSVVPLPRSFVDLLRSRSNLLLTGGVGPAVAAKPPRVVAQLRGSLPTP